jgi:hypothetical protein
MLFLAKEQTELEGFSKLDVYKLERRWQGFPPWPLI